MRLRISEAALLAFLIIVTPASASQLDDCRQRTIVVTVLDDRGFPLGDLDPSNFTFELHGKPVQIQHVVKEPSLKRLLVLLDASETMRETATKKWQTAQIIAQHALAYGPPANSVQFATIGSKVEPRLRADRAPRRADLAASAAEFFDTIPLKVDRSLIQARGPLFDLILQGIQLLDPPEPGDVILLITDGANESSRASPNQVKQKLLGAGVRLFAVTLPMRYEKELSVIRPWSGDKPFAEQEESTDFLNLVRGSAGKSFRVRPKLVAQGWAYDFSDDEKMALATSLQLLYLQIAPYYRIQVTLPDAPGQISALKAKLLPPEKFRKDKLIFLAPSQVSACDSVSTK